MITKEKLDVLYASDYKNNIFGRVELIELGFTAYDITKLTAEGVLSRIGRGNYRFMKERVADSLGEESVSKKKEKIVEEKKETFPKENTQELFLKHLRSHEYSKAVPYFQSFYESTTVINQDYKNAFLILADYNNILPEKYHDQVVQLINQKKEKFNDDNVTYYNLFLLISGQRFLKASGYLEKFDNRTTSFDEAFQLLLLSANHKKRRINTHIKKLFKSKDYFEIIEFLELKKDSPEFSAFYACVLQLAYDYISIEKTGDINRDYVAIPSEYNNGFIKLIIEGKFVEAATYRANILSLPSFDDINDFIFLMLMDIINLKNRLIMNGESRKREKK